MAITSLPHIADTETAEVLDDLIRDSLRTLLPVTVALAWLWLAAEILAGEVHVGQAYAVLALLTATAAACHRLHRRRLGVSVGVYLSGVVVAVTIVASALQGAAALYLYMLVVLIAAMLANPRTMWCVTVASMGLVLLGGLAGRGLPLAHVISVLLRASGSKPLSWPPSRPATLPCAVRPRECCGA